MVYKTLNSYLSPALTHSLLRCVNLSTCSRPDSLWHVIEGFPRWNHCLHFQFHSPYPHYCSSLFRPVVLRIQSALSCYPYLCTWCFSAWMTSHYSKEHQICEDFFNFWDFLVCASVSWEYIASSHCWSPRVITQTTLGQAGHLIKHWATGDCCDLGSSCW